MFKFKVNNNKKADRNNNKANAPRRRFREEGIWVHYTYYYYPDIEIYFQIETGTWFYREGVKWKAVTVLPVKLKKKQMFSTYRVKLHYTGCNPTLLHNMNKAKYPARPKQSGKKNVMMKEKKKTRSRTFYIPVKRSDLVAYEIDHVDMNFHQN